MSESPIYVECTSCMCMSWFGDRYMCRVYGSDVYFGMGKHINICGKFRDVKLMSLLNLMKARDLGL